MAQSTPIDWFYNKSALIGAHNSIQTHLYAILGQLSLDRERLARINIWIVRLVECLLELLYLIAREYGPAAAVNWAESGWSSTGRKEAGLAARALKKHRTVEWPMALGGAGSAHQITQQQFRLIVITDREISQVYNQRSRVRAQLRRLTRYPGRPHTCTPLPRAAQEWRARVIRC